MDGTLAEQRFLITGTGRCGTTWAADVCDSVGLYVRHQSFRHEHALGLTPWSIGQFDGEVSHEAAPVCDEFEGYRIVLLWRSWEKVVKSWMGLGMFQPGWEEPYHMFYDSIMRFCPEVCEWRRPVDQATQFWVSWNQLVVPYADVWLRVEGLTADGLLESIGWADVDRVPYEPPSDTNNRSDVKEEVEWVEPDPDLVQLATNLEDYLT